MSALKFVLIPLLVFIPACEMLHSKLSPEKIETNILEETSIGSLKGDVLGVCLRRQLTCKQNLNHGYYYQPGGGVEPKVVGVTSMSASLKDYKTSPFSTVSTTVYWGFDAEDKLIGVWVWQTIDSI